MTSNQSHHSVVATVGTLRDFVVIALTSRNE